MTSLRLSLKEKLLDKYAPARSLKVTAYLNKKITQNANAGQPLTTAQINKLLVSALDRHAKELKSCMTKINITLYKMQLT